MKQLSLKTSLIPPALRGTVGCNDQYVPQFWLTRWTQLFLFGQAESTKECATRSLLRLYETAHAVNGSSLDATLSNIDFPNLRHALSSHLQKLNNEAVQREIDLSRSWQWCIRFVEDVLEDLGKRGDERWSETKGQINALANAYANFSLDDQNKKPAVLRSLPSAVVSDLYEIFDPHSLRNPFRSRSTRYLNQLIFLTLLHLGIRRGELLLLYVDSVASEFDHSAARNVTWVTLTDIDSNGDPKSLIDPRSPAPSLKNALARRILPVSEELLGIYDHYLDARPPSPWPHVFLSQKGHPISLRRLNEIFESATAALSTEAVKALSRQGKDRVQPHDFRHTCAVRRLVGYRTNGFNNSEAIEKLRVFLGWHEKSEMPRRYARAYYETDYDTVWQDKYDSYVAAIRAVDCFS